MAILLEHYAGNMPTWLCPEQVRVLGVRDDHDAYAIYVAETLALEGVRAGVEGANEPLARASARPSSRRSLHPRGRDDDVEKARWV